MPTISVFEPALCCNTGVCGEDLDENLVTFTADAAWLSQQGASIARYNLANDPLAFAHNSAVKGFLEIEHNAPPNYRCPSNNSPQFGVRGPRRSVPIALAAVEYQTDV